jgi:hypothetical protein
MLRFMTWLCSKDDIYRNLQIVIVTGPNQELTIKLIKRVKALFTDLGIMFESKESVLELNGCTIEAYHSNHIGDFRSLNIIRLHVLFIVNYYIKVIVCK